ncbi:MAG: hypothetical protein WDN28_04420 [Chthoniobacter sp.]
MASSKGSTGSTSTSITRDALGIGSDIGVPTSSLRNCGRTCRRLKRRRGASRESNVLVAVGGKAQVAMARRRNQR